jgi:hypothetical protein
MEAIRLSGGSQEDRTCTVTAPTLPVADTSPVTFGLEQCASMLVGPMFASQCRGGERSTGG